MISVSAVSYTHLYACPIFIMKRYFPLEKSSIEFCQFIRLQAVYRKCVQFDFQFVLHCLNPSKFRFPVCFWFYFFFPVLVSKDTSISVPRDSFSFERIFAGNAMKCLPSPFGNNDVSQLELPTFALTAINPKLIARYSRLSLIHIEMCIRDRFPSAH